MAIRSILTQKRAKKILAMTGMDTLITNLGLDPFFQKTSDFLHGKRDILGRPIVRDEDDEDAPDSNALEERDSADDVIFDKEQYLIPSPTVKQRDYLDKNLIDTTKTFKNIVPKGDFFMPEWKGMTMDERKDEDFEGVSTPQKRFKRGIRRGMDVDAAFTAEQQEEMGLDEGNFRDLFTQGGKHNQDFDLSADRTKRIHPDIKMRLHAYVPNKNFTKIQIMRQIKQHTSFMRPGIRRFKEWARGNKKNSSVGKMLNDKIKRSVVLDYMQAEIKKNPDLEGIRDTVTREELRSIYELAYKQYKEDDTAKTNLDNTDAPISPEVEAKKPGLIRQMKEWIDAQNTGHAWIELTSNYEDENAPEGEERVRFTMGYNHTGELGSVFDKLPGQTENPDVDDNSRGDYVQEATIGKDAYIRALVYTTSFNESTYALTGANCTSFAVGMAKEAGMNVKGGYMFIPPFGKIYSPDLLAHSPTMIKLSKDYDYELSDDDYEDQAADDDDEATPEGYTDSSVEAKADANDPQKIIVSIDEDEVVISRTFAELRGDTLHSAVRDAFIFLPKYMETVGTLPTNYAAYWNMELKEKIKNPINKLNKAQKVYLRLMLDNTNNNRALDAPLERFLLRYFDKVMDGKDERTLIEDARKDRTGKFKEYAESEFKTKRGLDKDAKLDSDTQNSINKKIEHLLIPTAKGMLEFFSKRKRRHKESIGDELDKRIKLDSKLGAGTRAANPELLIKSFCLAIELEGFQRASFMKVYFEHMKKSDLRDTDNAAEFVEQCFVVVPKLDEAILKIADVLLNKDRDENKELAARYETMYL